MAARRIPAPLEGSKGRRGPRERGFCRGLAEIVDLNESLEGVGEREVVERERWAREEAWVGTLTLLGRWANKDWILGWSVNGVGRIEERERESEAVANGGAVVWSLVGTMASGFCSSEDLVSGFSRVWVLGSI